MQARQTISTNQYILAGLFVAAALTAIIGFTANTVSLFLGLRSLPNVMAVIGVACSASFLAYFLLRPIFLLP